MYKLESYITPILLGYVAKYVKNIRDEDAQLSLWEGEVTFHNLDMRVDVLEEELNLPVELVSGHIHELSIQVPWTKLMSEPVRIVINTIEFVAKLPGDEGKDKRAANRRTKRATSVEDPQRGGGGGGGGAGSGMVNKIINNISLQCNNIILKYVEDDIVVSMNVQNLNFTSANDCWKPAMVDVSPVNVLIRKLLEISDLTICLDKRNTAGRIEVCQEPVLYRCTLECRVLRKYNANTQSTSSTTRIGVFTKALDINVSSLQFPMVMRLVKMLLELKPNEQTEEMFTPEDTEDAEAEEQASSAPTRPSMFWRAWNMLPSFEASHQSDDADEPPGHAFDVGIYAEELNFQLKNSEYFNDHAMGGMKRIRYTPILRISLGGIYYERSQIKESDWANVKAGLSSICMEPLGAYRSDDPVHRTLVNTGKNETSFFDKSLFDEQYMFADRNWCSTNYADYTARITDEYMLYRSPVLAFDIVEYRSMKPNQTTSQTLGELGELGLRVQYRLLSAGITFHYSQSFLQVKNVITDLLRPYDYPGYHVETIETMKREHRRHTRDFTYADLVYLRNLMPLCNFKVELRNMTVQFFPRLQAEDQPPQRQSSINNKPSQLPYLKLQLPLVEGTFCGPSDPEKLVHLITQLPQKPKELVDICYTTYKFNVKNLTLTAENTTPLHGKSKLLHIPRMSVNFTQLVMPKKWPKDMDLAQETSDIQTEIISLEFSKRELILIMRVISLMIQYDATQMSNLIVLAANDSLSLDVIKLQTLATKFRFNHAKYKHHQGVICTLRSVNTDVYHTEMNIRNVVLSSNKGSAHNWLNLQLQIPLADQGKIANFCKEEEHEHEKVAATVIGFWVQPCSLTLDIHLLQFLQFREKAEMPQEKDTDNTDSEAVSVLDHTRVSAAYSILSSSSHHMSQLSEAGPRRLSRNSRKVSVPAETIHLSSDRDEKPHKELPSRTETIEQSRDPKYIADLIDRLSRMIIVVETAEIKVYVCEVMNRRSSINEALEFTSIRLPAIKLKAGDHESLRRGNMRQLHLVACQSTNYHCTCELNDLNVCYRKGSTERVNILAPIRTTISVAFAHKRQLHEIDDTETENSFFVENDTKLADDVGTAEKKVDWTSNETQLKEFNSFSINMHVDMTPINVYAYRIKMLYENFLIIHQMWMLLEVTEPVAVPNQCPDPTIKIYTGAPQNCPQIMEFLDLDPEFEPFDNPAPTPRNEILTITFFGQWTIPRITFAVESLSGRKFRKMVLTLEELLLNMDNTADFSKLTAKVENIIVDYYRASHTSDWIRHEGIQFKMLSDSTNLPLLSVVITTVKLQDLYAKIGVRKPQSRQQKNTISELLIEIQPLELVVDLDELTAFITKLCDSVTIMRSSKPNKSECAHVTTVNDLPMMHLNSKGIFIYMPMKTDKQWSTVLLLRIESIKLTPNLENPLVRHPVRQDVYHKAAELGMLNTPGALVEDRQYELSVRRISLSSGDWIATQAYRAELSSTSHSNPAFEWNNQTPAAELNHMDIFKDFDFIAIYAPAMTYGNLLVCGETLEYNCVSDFIASLTTHQITLISCIILATHGVFRSVNNCMFVDDCDSTSSSSKKVSAMSTTKVTPNDTRSGSLSYGTLRTLPSFLEATSASDTTFGISQCDSGIYLPRPFNPPLNNMESMPLPVRQHYPITVSFVAGVFQLRIYDVVASVEEKSHETDIAQQEQLRPLFMVTLEQPSFMTTQSLTTLSTQASVFNFKVHVPSKDHAMLVVPSSERQSGRFSDILFDTLPGNLGSSYIPPPLLIIKSQRDRLDHMELDVALSKPIVLRMCDGSVKRLISDIVLIYRVLHESPCFAMRTERQVVRTTPLRQLKLQCFNADRVHFACDRLTIRFFDESKTYNCSAVCLDFNFNIKFIERPQKASIKSSLGALYIHAGDKIFLHPLYVRLSADLQSETWCEQLLITAILKFNMLHLDVSILTMLELRKARDGLVDILDHWAIQWRKFLHSRPMLGNPADIPFGKLCQYATPKKKLRNSKEKIPQQAEYYQDDLRAGAFQFVYLNTDAVLPMPYQVQIIKKNYGIICWRYPQPRKMHCIHIYPVPMPVNSPIHIKCRMEYFSEPYETFLHYCDFELSETACRQIAPPERTICANIWRVVIMQSLVSVDGACFETDEDEELQSIDSAQAMKLDPEKDFILHPKVLVGCMRIDSTFQASCVPKIQVLLSCKDILLNLLNQPDKFHALPSHIKRYRLKGSTEISQTFATFHIEDLNFFTTIFNRNEYSMETGFRARIKCLDNGFLNMVDILEPTTFRSYISFDECKRLLIANLLVEKMRINCGPCVIHTLLSSKQHWEELLEERKVLHALLPKCIIVNRIHTHLSFGQTETNERIRLEPLQVHLYHFNSDLHAQELTFFIENPKSPNQVDISDSVHIPFKFEEEQKVRYLRVGKRCITIKVRKLSATQVYVLIKGQIEVINMVPFELLCEFRRDGKDYDEQAPMEHSLIAKQATSFYYSVARNADINMRLRLTAGLAKGRTGDIPLKPNNSLPWLVKVPTQKPQQFISLWVRILREDMQLDCAMDEFYPQKILVSIWPIFEICNLLSCPVLATDTSVEEKFSIAGEGERLSLSTATTHMTEHKVTFDFPAPIGEASQPEYTFMLKAMDWHKFFHFDHNDWNIETTLLRMSKPLKPKWPLNDFEELLVRRNTELAHSFDFSYRAEATRDFSCTLGLSILPWGIFINATGAPLSICRYQSTQRYILQANSLEMMPVLNGLFCIEVPYGSSWIASSPMCLEEFAQQIGSGRHAVLRANSYVDLVVVRNQEVLKFMLEFKQVSEQRVFKVRSKFVIANFTDVALQALPLAVDHKETFTRADIYTLQEYKQQRNLVPTQINNRRVGFTVDKFYDLNAYKVKHSSDTAFVYFVCFTVSGSDISIPISLAMPFTRRCFSLQNGSESVPLVATLIEKEHIFYLNVMRDTAPAILIHNQTNVKFIVAQTSASGNSNVTSTTPEFVGKHFEWNQLVAPQSKCYYTPPQMYANFPDVEFSICNLSLAVHSDEVKKQIGWSKPIRTDREFKKFLHVPCHGDVKVVVCNKHRVIRVSIYYIAQQLEFSVKDLRSRLNKPETSPTLPEEVSEEKEKETPEFAVQVAPTPTDLGEQDDCIHFSNDCPLKRKLQLRLFIKKFVFSLQSESREREYMKSEVCNIYADDTIVAFDDAGDGGNQRALRVQIPNLQVDNQLYTSGRFDFPVLLCAEQMYKRTGRMPSVYELNASDDPAAIARLTFVFYHDEMQLDEVRCQFQPFRVYIEDAYLNQLLETLVECEPSNCVYTPNVENERINLGLGQTLLPDEVVAQATYISDPLRLSTFTVEPLNMLLSVHTSSRLYIALDHSPLSFSRYERQQILTVPLRFGQSLGLHYLSGAIFGAGWVVGSLEILGSPSGLARSFTNGLRDFISMPVEGLFRGPWGFVVGVTQGSASLLRNVTAGTVNSVTKLASSVARNLDRLTLDAEHIELTEARRRARPQGFTEGLTQGMTGLGISLLGAVGGLAHHTLEARSSVGVITGLTKGIVGALTKPISGAAEMLALTGQGVLHTVGFNAMPQQVEPSVLRNVALHRCSYCIWRYLPEKLSRDQILFFYEITLLLQQQLQPALIFLTSTLLVIMEANNDDDLTFVSPVFKVDIVADREDPTKFYLNLKPEEETENSVGLLSTYTNERIMSFLQYSDATMMSGDSLSDLLHLPEEPDHRQTQCIFYIKQNIGEHLMHYLKVINKIHQR